MRTQVCLDGSAWLCNEVAMSGQFSHRSSNSLPIATRMASEIPKPKDWQDFQRKCVVLYKCELRDPHTRGFGRNGQSQDGVDILGRRDGDVNSPVGIQCRRVDKPLRYKEILSDCTRALALTEKPKEIIFATTAPDDKQAEIHAKQVERELRAKGHDITVVLYGWGELQNIICMHDEAYNLFAPVQTSGPPSVPTVVSLSPDYESSLLSKFTALVAAQCSAELREAAGGFGKPLVADEAGGGTATAEDPALHGRIDAYRDMFQSDKQPQLAEKSLLGLLNSPDIEKKPWALYRIRTNLASIALYLGRADDAVLGYEQAHLLQPNDPGANANLALARLFQGRFDEAFSISKGALESTPRSDAAICYLLQAAARCAWGGDPVSLIPPDLVGTLHADLGLAEFYLRRDCIGWERSCLDAAKRHPDAAEFKPIVAVAVLSLVINSDFAIAGGPSPVSSDELRVAADGMLEYTRHIILIGFVDEYNFLAHVNNACVLLRLCGRHKDIEELLILAGERASQSANLRRHLALALAIQGRRREAMTILENDEDPESRLLFADLTAPENAAKALQHVLSIPLDGLTERLTLLRWLSVAELSVRSGRIENLSEALIALRILQPNDIAADIFEIRGQLIQGLSHEEFQDRLRALANHVREDAPLSSLRLLADELRAADLPEEASRLLDNKIDLSRFSPALILYLQSLAEARRDDALQAALDSVEGSVKDEPDILKIMAVHSWMAGDLDKALVAANRLAQRSPDAASGRLLKIDILLRKNELALARAELDQPLEGLIFERRSERLRLIKLLGVFGYVDRAAKAAYRAYLENQNDPQAWMTFASVILGRGQDNRHLLWAADTIGPDIAVDILYENGATQFFILEPDGDLRRLDPQAWEPDHALAKSIVGLFKGSTFINANGRTGTIADVRHKYVARLHFIMQNYEVRFPGMAGFQSIKISPDLPNGLDDLREKLKARHEWASQEIDRYKAGQMPLSMLAHCLGVDVVEAAAGLVASGVSIKVSLGNDQERRDAFTAINKNDSGGCVLDLYSFWLNWRLKALEEVVAVCGKVYVAQSTIDGLRAMRERAAVFARDGHKSASYENGSIAFQTCPADVVQDELNRIDAAIDWLEQEAVISPVVASDDLPAELRRCLRLGLTTMFDSIIIAIQTKHLLLADDLWLRNLARGLGVRCSSWSQPVFLVAEQKRIIKAARYVEIITSLIAEGHTYIGVNGRDLSFAAAHDFDTNAQPRMFDEITRMIGGQDADQYSHMRVVAEFIQQVSSHLMLDSRWSIAASHVLRQLLRSRHEDYRELLAAVARQCRSDDEALRFLDYWARGHFITWK